MGADQLRDTPSNHAWGGALQGLVSALGASQRSQSTGTRTWFDDCAPHHRCPACYTGQPARRSFRVRETHSSYFTKLSSPVSMIP